MWLNPSHTYVKLQIDPNQIDRNAHFFSETGCLEFMVLASRDPFDHQHKLHYITGATNIYIYRFCKYAPIIRPRSPLSASSKDQFI